MTRKRRQMDLLKLAVALGVATVTVIALTVITGAVAATDSRPAVYDAAQIARGEYLVAVTACNDCHTPFKLGPEGPEPDMSRMLSGHPEDLAMPAPAALEGPWVWQGSGSNTAFAGPWGVSYSANLTPDENTGLGIWTEEIFIRTMRTGRHWGQSRPILPPMPWPAFSRMTDDDLRAVYAYLRSIPAITNRVPEAVLAGQEPEGIEAWVNEGK